MNFLDSSFVRFPRRTALTTTALLVLTTSSVFAQDNDTAAPDPGQRRERPEGGERRNFDPSAMRERMQDFLRQRLEVTDDAEWDIIKERIAKVTELRQSSSDNPAGSMRALAAIGGGGGPGQGGRDGANANAGNGGGGPGGNFRQRGGREGAVPPEAVALVQALRSQSSEAEIISRLAKLRAARQLEADTLAQAQEDLRIVLTPRQEAIAVIAGLLP